MFKKPGFGHLSSPPDSEIVDPRRQHGAALQILDGLILLKERAEDNGMKLLGYLLEMAIHEATDRAEEAGAATKSN